MAEVCSSIVSGGVTRAASMMGDFMPVIALAVAVPLFAALALWLRSFFGGR